MGGTRTSRALAAIGLGLVAAGWVGCDHTLEGPEPTLTSVATPHLVCNEQISTSVILAGSGFSPLPVDTALAEPRLVLPSITLARNGDLMGGSATSESIVVPDDCSRRA